MRGNHRGTPVWRWKCHLSESLALKYPAATCPSATAPGSKGSVAEWFKALVLKTNDGRVAEWSIAAVLKTADVQASVGSNPTPSANSFNRLASFSSARKTLLQVRYKVAIKGCRNRSAQVACSRFVATVR